MSWKFLKFWTTYALTTTAIIGGIKACNDAIYNTVKKTENYTFISEGNFMGIKEYTRYNDGPQELRITGPITAILHEFYEDINGDGLVDVIKESTLSSGIRTGNILDREKDYKYNAKKFDDADKQIQEYMKM